MSNQHPYIAFLLLTLAIAVQAGCHLGKHPCSVDTCTADSTAILHSSSDMGHVLADFETFGLSHSKTDQPLPIANHFASDSAAIDLEECCCAAAVNSPLADAIDKERKALCCSGIQNDCVDKFLIGQSLSLRNKAAGAAGELYLRLVEITLQQQLLNESLAKLKDLRAASNVAEQQGFATVDADAQLDKQRIELKGKQADLEKAHVAVTAKLNTVLGISLCNPKTIYPKFELIPIYEPVDVCQEIETAFANRSDLNSLGSSQCGCLDSECFSVLSQLDPRLGMSAAATAAIRKCRLLTKVCRQHNPASGAKSEQYRELKSAQQELVRLEVTEAVLDIQSGYKKLTLATENIQRLDTRMAALEAGSELEPLPFFLKSIEVWAERQTAKSNQITTAIEFEIAKIKLLQATGQWTQICGLSPHDPCNCDQ